MDIYDDAINHFRASLFALEQEEKTVDRDFRIGYRKAMIEDVTHLSLVNHILGEYNEQSSR